MNTHLTTFHPYASPFDPCKPILEKAYSTPPHLYLGFQPPNLTQFSPIEALKYGTLWRDLYDPWFSPYERPKGGAAT